MSSRNVLQMLTDWSNM